MAIELRPGNRILVGLSDGDTANRPSRLSRPPPGATDGDWYDVADEKITKHWRKHLGMYLARLLDFDSSKTWYLHDFPADYQLYTHKKGPVAAPRKDHYLYGSDTPFRSPAEFEEHLAWLIHGCPRRETDGSPDCECRYCSPQHIEARRREGEERAARVLKPAERPLITRPPKDYRQLAPAA